MKKRHRTINLEWTKYTHIENKIEDFNSNDWNFSITAILWREIICLFVIGTKRKIYWIERFSLVLHTWPKMWNSNNKIVTVSHFLAMAITYLNRTPIDVQLLVPFLYKSIFCGLLSSSHATQPTHGFQKKDHLHTPSCAIHGEL